MNHWIRGLMIGIGTGMLVWIATTGAQAEVDININIGLPPLVAVQTPPTMLYLSEPGIYVAIGISHDIYFMDGHYYYFHAGNWFRGPGYGGPWVHAGKDVLPPGLRKFKIKHLRAFRDAEFKTYQDRGPRYKGKHFVAVKGTDSKSHAPKMHRRMNQDHPRGKKK